MVTKDNFFQFEIIINVLVSSFCFICIMNTYVMGLRPLQFVQSRPERVKNSEMYKYYGGKQ